MLRHFEAILDALEPSVAVEFDPEAARLIYHAKTGCALTRPQYMRRCKKEGVKPLPMAQWREIVETASYDGPEEDDEPTPEYPRHEELAADTQEDRHEEWKALEMDDDARDCAWQNEEQEETEEIEQE